MSSTRRRVESSSVNDTLSRLSCSPAHLAAQQALHQGQSLASGTVQELIGGILRANTKARLAGEPPRPPPPPPPPSVHDASKVADSISITREMFEYVRLIESPDLCKVVLGVDVDELEFIVEQLMLAKYKKPRRDAVLLLAAMRRAFSFNELQVLMGVSDRNVSRRVKRCALALAERFRSEGCDVNGKVGFISLETLLGHVQARADVFDGWLGQMAWIFVDGTSLQTYEPEGGDMSRAMHVPYKKHHALRWTCLCASNGRVLHVTPVEVGSLDDNSVWLKSNLAGELNTRYAPEVAAFGVATNTDDAKDPFLVRRLCVGADKGYRGLDSSETFKIVCTASGEKEPNEKGKKLGTVFFSDKIARGRSVVERVFAHLKRRHGIIEFYDCPTANIDGNMLNNMILVACTLLNRKIEMKQLKI